MSNLDNIFDVEPTNVVVVETEVPETDSEHTEDVDFIEARKRQYELSEMTQASLHTAMRIAAESENPRAIEVLAGLLKTANEVNKQLITLSKDKADVKAARGGRQSNSVPQIGTQQNLFVGGGADINKILSDRMKTISG